MMEDSQLRTAKENDRRRREIQKRLKEIPSDETLTDLQHAVSSCFGKLDKYYQVQSDLVYSATVLNPTLNVAYFTPVEVVDSQTSIDDVKKEVEDVYVRDYAPKVEHQQSKSSSQDSSVSMTSRIHRRLSNQVVESRPANYELEMYCQIPLASPETNILTWWNTQKLSLPNLANMARDILSIPASSTPSERAFSMAKHLLPPTRNSMTSDTIEACMMLKLGLIKNKE